MSHYTSENTHILATHEQAGGNTRMLLFHECASGIHEYVIGSYFTVRAPLERDGLIDEQGRVYDETTSKQVGVLEGERAKVWKHAWPGMVKQYSWDWGHYFEDVVSAVDYWKREVMWDVVELYEVRDSGDDCEGWTLQVSFGSGMWRASMHDELGRPTTYEISGFATKGELLHAFSCQRPALSIERVHEFERSADAQAR